MRRHLALLFLVTLLVIGPAGAVGPARTPGAAATAWGIRVSVPNQSGTGTTTVVSPPNGAPAIEKFAYPSDGSVVAADSSTASAVTEVKGNASARADSVVTALSLFKGEITADGVTAHASAGTGYSGAGGNVNGSGVNNLKVNGQPVALTPGTTTKVTLGDWGQLTAGSVAVDQSAPDGAQGYRGFITEIDVHLTADHGGLPANSEIQVGYADAAAQTAPPVAPATPTTTTSTDTGPATTTPDVAAGDAPRDRARPGGSKTSGVPLKVQPKLTAGHYVFPVYGPSSYIDTFGAARSDVSFHHGDDIFGQLGQPLLAVADGTVFSVGWNKVGGNRLWLLDEQGNQFYYAHLSAFSTAAVNGARVKAGEVVGFMGRTGDAEGTPYHLHFEVHPVSFLYLGYDGAVDPTPYLDAWSHQKDLPFPVAAGWAPAIPGGPAAPEPGAILLGMTDISTADGLDPASLERALTPLKPSALMQTLVPTQPAPSKDLGRG
ncbi:MAG: peptidoglycan LD-endopeptidase LytH [Gaiellaceae bacterium]|nr:peptidoglycan LD-endopeptidase LytH [Gaiellaceae bacterium]